VSGFSATIDALLGVGLLGAFLLQMLRWLRVLQREHYVASSLSRFLLRWSTPSVSSSRMSRFWRYRPVTLSQVLVVLFIVAWALDAQRWAALDVVAYGVICPLGLSIKGRTSSLDWTRRLTTVSLVATALAIVVVVAGLFSSRVWIVPTVLIVVAPFLIALSDWLLAPFEDRAAKKFVDQATERLGRVHPLVIAITGSYGKTSTKNHLATLLGSDQGVVASPRSFNNRAGLSRAINENLADGTRIFIAEMGTYGPGEIAALCAWCPPDIAVVTAIGPVHLERMKSLENIERAKYEITTRARVVVLNVDDVRLAGWVKKLETEGKSVRTAGSSAANASVLVSEVAEWWRVVVGGEQVASMPRVVGVQASNLACAFAAALEAGSSVDQLVANLGSITAVANRANVLVAPSGVTVVDDTFNANPASADAALSLLSSLRVPGRIVVITPGLIELGPVQVHENMALASKVAALGAQLVVIGRTNARALARGFKGNPRRFDTRDEAVTWVRGTLGAGDAVLYLNDLPDHYP
jgi:UDP-N-acetylmuramoyl-tripeptide--D-alanyl-D-alanine ligase